MSSPSSRENPDRSSDNFRLYVVGYSTSTVVVIAEYLLIRKLKSDKNLLIESVLPIIRDVMSLNKSK